MPFSDTLHEDSQIAGMICDHRVRRVLRALERLVAQQHPTPHVPPVRVRHDPGVSVRVACLRLGYLVVRPGEPALERHAF